MHANNKNKLNNTKKSVKILLSITILNKILFRFILNNESGKNWLGHHIKHEGGIILNTRGIITKTEGFIIKDHYIKHKSKQNETNYLLHLVWLRQNYL